MPIKTAALILAAGKGERMRSKQPKVLHQICGEPMALWAIKAVRATGALPVLIVGYLADAVKQALGNDQIAYAMQHELLGTGDAVKAAKEFIVGTDYTIVTAGDMPLVREETMCALQNKAILENYDAVILTAVLNDPTGYGRIVRDETGAVTGIVEQKALTGNQAQICETNTSVYCFSSNLLLKALETLQPAPLNNGEYLLTDAIAYIAKHGRVATLSLADNEEGLGINNRVQLAQANAIMQKRTNEKHMLAGVTILDPSTTFIGGNVQIGMDTVIYPNNTILGNTTIGEDCVLHPGNRIVDGTIAHHAEIQNSTITGASVGAYTTVGPNAFLRPETIVGEHVRIGDFVELKNAKIGDGTKISHLTYVGDAVVGARCNLGCGVVFSNYDGYTKQVCVVEDDVFIGCNVNLIAPVQLGSGSYIAAGSTVTRDVPKNALCIARSRETIKEGWALERRLKYFPKDQNF